MPKRDNRGAADEREQHLEYINARYAQEDDLLRELLDTARAEGLPSIQVSPALGKTLALLVRIAGARRVLEIGTLAGYSTIWMGRALPENGTLVSLEIDPRHAAIANRFVTQAGLAEKVDIRVGPAIHSLDFLAGGLPFDMAFIDADKDNYPAYLDWALRLVRPGGIIAADNVLRAGVAQDAASSDPSIQAIQTYNDRVARDPRLDAIILLTRNGNDNNDGFSVAFVRPDVDRDDELYYRE